MDNLRCGRQCDFINRPAYIVLFKGDDSDFQGNQSVDIVIDTELDTTGMKAHFRFMDFVQDFNSIPENKTLRLVFPNAKTSEFPLGAADATLRFEDASGKFRTISNRIHIVVTNSVHEAYDNEDSQSITVTVKGTVTWEMIEGKPTIPDPVTIDTALSQTSTNPVQNKVVAKALYTGFTEWEFSGVPSGIIGYYLYWNTTEEGWIFFYYIEGQQGIQAVDAPGGEDAVSTTFSVQGSTVVATRRLITPTKTSQLTNDGPSSGPNVGHPFATTNQIPAPVDISGKLDDSATYDAWEQPTEYSIGEVVSYKGFIYRCINEGNHGIPPDGEYGPNVWTPTRISELLGGKQDKLSDTQIGYINDVPSKADKAVPSAAGNLASLTETGNLADSGVKPSDFATPSDLPYRLVEPGKWEFSGSGYDPTAAYSVLETPGYDSTAYQLKENGDIVDSVYDGITDALSVNFNSKGITATRPSLPGHLLDRVNNLIDATTGNVTLTMPPFVAGKVRDLLVACTIGLDTNDEPWSVIFQGQGSEAPSGADEISFKAEGDDASTATFPVPDAAGDWWYSLTERAPHVFAVSLKQLQSVSQPTQTQGGS